MFSEIKCSCTVISSSKIQYGGAELLSHLGLLAAPRTAAHQAPLPNNFPGKNSGVGCHFLLQGIFPTQRSN